MIFVKSVKAKFNLASSKPSRAWLLKKITLGPHNLIDSHKSDNTNRRMLANVFGSFPRGTLNVVQF